MHKELDEEPVTVPFDVNWEDSLQGTVIPVYLNPLEDMLSPLIFALIQGPPIRRLLPPLHLTASR